MAKIDLIIPCYNAHDTVIRTLGSVLSQTVRDEIRVILVDDNSDKRYNSIVNRFKQFLDIKLIRLNSNVGPGKARRLGMKAGTSKYIMFIDADDTFFNAYSVGKMLYEIEKRQCNICYSNFIEDAGSGRYVSHINDGVWLFGKIYKREFLENLNIYINDTRANEDVGFNTLTRAFTQPQHVDEITYIWHYNPKSITRRNNALYSFTCTEGHVTNKIWAFKEAYKRGYNRDNYLHDIASQFCWYYFEYFNVRKQTREEVDVDKFISWIQRYYNAFKGEIKECVQKNIIEEEYKRAFNGYYADANKIQIIDVPIYHFIDLLEHVKE